MCVSILNTLTNKPMFLLICTLDNFQVYPHRYIHAYIHACIHAFSSVRFSSVQFFTLNLTYMHTYIYRKQCSGAEGDPQWQFDSCQARAVCTAAWMPAARTTAHLRHSFASGLLRSTRSRHRCDRRRNGGMAAGRLLPA